MKKLFVHVQEDTVTTVDTLTENYSRKWDAVDQLSESGAFIQAVASDDLIYIVLAVSLIIWLVLLFFIIRVDKKVGRLEQQIEQNATSE